MLDPTPRLEYRVLDTGYCLASEHHLIRGGARRKIHCHAIVALLKHPRHGWLLWDTGYAPRMFDATHGLPYRLYRLATPLRLDSDLAAVAQLPRLDLTPAQIGAVILSHFHADHLCGLRDFPHAQIIATQSAYDDVAGRTGWRALRRGFLPSLMPDDFRKRMTLLPTFSGPPLGGFGPTHDWFGDGSVRFVMLPGHARGQMGMLVQTTDGPFFFVADGSWSSRAIRENLPPHWLTHLFIDDVQSMRNTLTLLHQFAKEYPDVTLIPTHCPETFRRFVGKEP